MLRETNHYFNDDELLANSVEKLAVNSNDPYLLMTLISRTRRELCFKGLQVGGRGGKGRGGLEAPGGSSASRASRWGGGGRGRGRGRMPHGIRAVAHRCGTKT